MPLSASNLGKSLKCERLQEGKLCSLYIYKYSFICYDADSSCAFTLWKDWEQRYSASDMGLYGSGVSHTTQEKLLPHLFGSGSDSAFQTFQVWKCYKTCSLES